MKVELNSWLSPNPMVSRKALLAQVPARDHSPTPLLGNLELHKMTSSHTD